MTPTQETVQAGEDEVEALRIFSPAANRIAGLVNDNHDAMLVSGAVRILIEDMARRLSSEQPARAASGAVRGELPIWLEGGVASRLSAAMDAYLAEYVYSPDEGCDHEPTEFERVIMNDMLYGALSSPAVTAILQNAAFDALTAAPAPALVSDNTKPQTWRGLDDARLQLAINAFYEPCEGTTIDGVRAAILAWEQSR